MVVVVVLVLVVIVVVCYVNVVLVVFLSIRFMSFWVCAVCFPVCTVLLNFYMFSLCLVWGDGFTYYCTFLGPWCFYICDFC